MEIKAGLVNKRTQEKEGRPFLRPFHTGGALPPCDVAIIGGGVIGCSVAFWLTHGGLKVTLLEAGEVGAGASGACDGFLSIQSKEPGPLMRMARDSLHLFSEMSERLGRNIEFAECGGMLVARTEAGLDTLRRLVPQAASQGVTVSILDPDQARELEPALYPGLAGTTLCESEAQVNPLALTMALAREASRGGAALVEHRPVKKIVNEGGAWSLHTAAGILRAERVVCCAGAWSAEVSAGLALAIPVTPLRGQILVTESAAPTLFHTLAGTEYLASKHSDPAGPPISADGRTGFTAEQTASGNILLGSTREEKHFNRSNTPEALRAISERARTYVPGLAGLSIIRAFAGLRPQSVDGLPIIGEVPGHSGFFLATGHGGDGMALSLRTGQLLASCIADDAVPDELAPFSPSRFPELG